MRTSLLMLTLSALALLPAACGGGASSTTGPGGPTLPNIAGRYNYESLATTMTCSNGTSVPLPAITDVLTITQSGNRFDGELGIAASVYAPAGASLFEDCLLANDGSYTCTGEYRDANAVTRFSGSGRFSGGELSGTTNLQMTLTDGTICSWSKQERGTKIS